MLRVDGGLEVVVDLPQFVKRDVKVAVTRHTGKSVLTISGKRELHYFDFSKGGKPIKVPYSPDKCKIIPNAEIKRSRQQSDFQFEVVLPQEINDILRDSRRHEENGVYAIFLADKDDETIEDEDDDDCINVKI